MNNSVEENILFEELKEWLIGILEEDPIPYEINYLYFMYGKINNMVYIRFLGCEIDNKENSDFTYNPLEAQFFYSHNLFKLFQNKTIISLKNFLIKSIHKINSDLSLLVLNNKNIKLLQLNYYV